MSTNRKFIETEVKLVLSNVIKYRKLISNEEMDEIIMNMYEYVAGCGAKPNRAMTITKGLNFETGKQLMDMEFMVEADQPIKGNTRYKYVPKFELDNCVMSNYKGVSQNASMATREVQNYIQKKELIPTSATHQVINNLKKISKEKNKKKEKQEDLIDMSVYISVK